MNADPKRLAPAARIAQRMDEIAPFHVVELSNRVGELKRAGHMVINLCIGEPDFPTPQPMLDAAAKALQSGRFPYTDSLGIPELRRAIAQFYWHRYQVKIAPERIAVTAGASAALLLTMGVLINPGEQVLLTDPGYPCNHQFIRVMGGNPVGVPVDSGSGYQLNAALIEQHWTADTVAALVASPANPTGTMIHADAMSDLIAAVQRRGGRLIVDEIYLALSYGREATTALSQSDDLFIVNSFSKYFQMTGWRLGWMVVPEALVPAIERLAQNLYICPSTIAQHAAIACFEPGSIAEYERRRAEFRSRRDFLVPALNALDLPVPVAPDGAFYAWADCSRHSASSWDFAFDLMRRAHVAITPGRDFGRHGTERMVRLSYASSMAHLQTAVERLRDALS
jgi:aspartate/methionine/tyrosine aminotransferase